MPETSQERLRRRLIHLTSHPIVWLRYVAGTELRHRELRFNLNPRFVDWRPMWRVARRPLGRLLATDPAQLDGIFAELAPLHPRLLAEAGPVANAGALMQAPLLYVLVRATRPRWIVETGISSGYSARLLLEAIRANGGGHLDSIGVDAFAMVPERVQDPGTMAGRRLGWLVPPELAPYWTLHVGKSDDLLPGLLAGREEPLDLFLHDSLHKYPTMRWEYETAWPRIPAGGFLASHDIHNNLAWPEFVANHGLTGREAELDHDLGVARRAAP